MELHHVGKLITRVLSFFAKGRRIVAAHGIRSKSQDIPARDRQVVLKRMKDWLGREES